MDFYLFLDQFDPKIFKMIFNHFKWDFYKIKWEILGFLDLFVYFVQIPASQIFNTA